MSVKNTKCVRKLERPRPLRSAEPPAFDPNKSSTPLLSPAEDMTSQIDSVMCPSGEELLLGQLESLCASIGNGNYGATVLSQTCSLLKVKGADLEAGFKDQLDRLFVTLRNASRDPNLDAAGRLGLLEVVELRAMGWQSDEYAREYYTGKFGELALEPTALDDASAVKQTCAFQQKQQQEQRSQMETVKAETKPEAPPTLPWASQEIKNPENPANPRSVSFRGPLKGEVHFQNQNIWKESSNLQDTEMQKSGSSDMPAVTTRQYSLRNEGVVQNANASTQGQQTEGVVGMAKKVISEDITQYSGPPMQDGKWADGTTADYVNGFLQSPPAGADGDAKTCVRTVTVGKDVVQISGTNGTIVNMFIMVLRSFFSEVAGDTPSFANQSLSCVRSGSGEPSNKSTVPGVHTDTVHAQGHTVGHSSFQKGQVDSSHGEAYKKDELGLVKEAVARPLRDTLQSANAMKAQSAQGSFETFGNTGGPSANKRFKGLESLTEFNKPCKPCTLPTDFKAWGSNDRPDQTKQLDGLGSSAQFSRTVDNKHMLLTGSKTLGATSEPGQPNQLKNPWNPSQFSSEDDGKLLSAGFTALGSSGEHSQARQFKRPLGSMQLSSNTENQKLEPSGDFKALDRNGRTDQGKRFPSSGSSTQFFSSFHEQVLPTKPLGTTNVLDQPKQLKGLERPALFSSKADSDNNRQPPSAIFTASGSTCDHSQTKHFEKLGAPIQFFSNTESRNVRSGNIKPLGYTDGTSQAAKEIESFGSSMQLSSNPENQQVPSGNVKPLGYTNGSSHTKQFGELGTAKQFSSNPDEHMLSAAFKRLSANDPTAGKRQLKGPASSPQFEWGADDQQVLASSTLSEAAGPPCSTGTGLKTYTRQFLLQCSQSSLATQEPPDFPMLDPEVASAMVRKADRKLKSEA